MNQRIQALDGLRGISVMCVLLLHVFPVQAFWFWSFVDMFFVLSGYLITTVVLRNYHAGSFGFRTYFARRILRIWPVYYATLAAAVILSLTKNAMSGGPPVEHEWLPSVFFLQNYQGYLGPWDTASAIAPWFRNSWSIAAEEQFYLLWPLALVLIRANPHAIVASMAVLVALGAWMRSQDYLLILLLTRIDGIAMGILLAVISSDRHGWYSRLNRPIVFWLALLTGSAIVAPYLIDGYVLGAIRNYGDIARVGNWTWNVTAFALIFFGLTGLVLLNQIRWLNALLSRRALVYLGTISYAMYMIQGVVRTLTHELFERLPFGGHLTAELATIPIVIGLSALSWRYFEQPINEFKRHFPMKGVVVERSGQR